MDLSLRRKGVWIAGSLCLLSSPVLWRVLRSVMTRGGHRQAPALEDTQVVTWPLSWLSVSGRGTGSPWQTECVSCLVLPRDGRPMGVGSGEVGSPCQHLQVSTNFRGTWRQSFLTCMKAGVLFLSVRAKNNVSISSSTSYVTYEGDKVAPKHNVLSPC